MQDCLFSFICRCLHFNVEHADMAGPCRARLMDGELCPCEQFQHNHDDICTPVELDP